LVGATTVHALADQLDTLAARLDRIESALQALVERQRVRDYYTTEEAAKALGRSEYTVREWCRLGRIHAEKKGSGRGKYQSWVVCHDELLRVQREGLLPVKK
jgi:excisionase family DNA binding protein